MSDDKKEKPKGPPAAEVTMAKQQARAAYRQRVAYLKQQTKNNLIRHIVWLETEVAKRERKLRELSQG